jgi:tetratricopeptide (TPR) repeat protein
VDAHLARAAALRSAGRAAEADEELQQADAILARHADERYPLRLADRLANMHAELGDAYADGGFLLEATEQYRRACEIRPAFVDIRNRLGRALMDLGLLEAAVREFTTALTYCPDYAEARTNLDAALHQAGHPQAGPVQVVEQASPT